MFKITPSPEKMLNEREYHFFLTDVLMLPSTKLIKETNRDIVQIQLEESEFEKLLKLRRDEKVGDEKFWNIIEDILKNGSEHKEYKNLVGVVDLEVWLEVPISELDEPVPSDPNQLHNSQREEGDFLKWKEWNAAGDQPIATSIDKKRCIVRTNIGAVAPKGDEILTLIKYAKKNRKIKILNRKEVQELLSSSAYQVDLL